MEWSQPARKLRGGFTGVTLQLGAEDGRWPQVVPGLKGPLAADQTLPEVLNWSPPHVLLRRV